MIALLDVDCRECIAGRKTGSGNHLYQAKGSAFPVVGVAKTRFNQATNAREVMWGSSQNLLFVTSIDIEVAEATRLVRGMHGGNTGYRS